MRSTRSGCWMSGHTTHNQAILPILVLRHSRRRYHMSENSCRWLVGRTKNDLKVTYMKNIGMFPSCRTSVFFVYIFVDVLWWKLNLFFMCIRIKYIRGTVYSSSFLYTIVDDLLLYTRIWFRTFDIIGCRICMRVPTLRGICGKSKENIVSLLWTV